jgi:hypothetical protein
MLTRRKEVLDLMFAAALSGMRTVEAADDGQPMAIDYSLVPGTQQKAPERDWRMWVGSDFTSFKDERDCPIFFQAELPGFGTLSVRSQCAVENEE